MAKRIRNAILGYAQEMGAHRNQVVAMKGSSEQRMRVGDFRVVFYEDREWISVTRLAHAEVSMKINLERCPCAM
jgi:mRNA-degrading endonuclease RelE of RelBE toxin-antitoxin system